MKKIISLTIALLVAISLFGIDSAQAKTIKVKRHFFADKQGKYVYYSIPTKGLYKINIRNYKKTKIKSSNVKKELSNGFSYITVKGKYIYAQWEKTQGSSGLSAYKPCICRITKKGKVKVIGYGYKPVVKGKYIYYRGYKRYEDYAWQISGKRMRMKLNGSGKKQIHNKIRYKKRKFSGLKIKKVYVGEEHYYYNMGLYLYKNGRKIKLGNWYQP